MSRRSTACCCPCSCSRAENPALSVSARVQSWFAYVFGALNPFLQICSVQTTPCIYRGILNCCSPVFIRTYVQFLPSQHIVPYLSYRPILRCSPLCGQQATQTYTHIHLHTLVNQPLCPRHCTSGWKNTGLIRTVPCF